jgi:uncharacterized protein DUF3574
MVGAVVLATTFGSFSIGPEQVESKGYTPEKYIRTELYFGFCKKDGTEVTSEEWKKFVDDEVTPRFPEGLTIVEAAGQFRLASGIIVHENSRMVILVYRRKDRTKLDLRIEAIRTAYCKKFDQESVMRVDLRRSIEVSFEE